MQGVIRIDMKSKLVKYLLVIAGICVLFFGIFLTYLFTNGFTNYVSFCSQYIPNIESHYQKYDSYPKQISSLNNPSLMFWHKPDECGYSVDNISYGFFVPHGLIGVAIYSSEWGKWEYD